MISHCCWSAREQVGAWGSDGERFKVSEEAVPGIFEFTRLALWAEMRRPAAGGPDALGPLSHEPLGEETGGVFGRRGPRLAGGGMGSRGGGGYEMQRSVGEAHAVVRQVRDHVLGPGSDAKVIGVVAFSRKQTRLIEYLLDKAGMDEPELEAAWHVPGRPELRVRNLGTAQRDERDVIVLSTTFGPDAEGRQRSRFGPFYHEGGYRSPDVAVTRARERVVVVSSLDPKDVETTRSPRGVKDLEAYLQTGKTGAGQEAEGSVGGYASSLEEQIVAVLEVRGRQVEPAGRGRATALMSGSWIRRTRGGI